MNRNTFIWNGIILLILGCIFGHFESKAYGSNNVAQTTSEAISDLITVIVFLTGYVLATIGLSMPKK